MKKLLMLICLSAFSFALKAQTPAPPPTTQPFGKTDVADLELKSCDFEKDANAEVLFSKGTVYFDQNFNIVMEVHRRIKIFNDNGKNNADIKIEYYGGNRYEYITNIEAQTINLVDGKAEITKIDKKQIFTKAIDKARSSVVFSFPNVKPGSILEYKYRWNTIDYGNFPDWYFQEKVPVRYSELTTEIPDLFYFKTQSRILEPLVKHTTSTEGRSVGIGNDAEQFSVDKETRGIANIHSIPEEPYMSSYADNLEGILYQLVSIKPTRGFTKTYSDSWAKVGGILIDDEDFGGQLKRKLKGEEEIIQKAKTLKNDEERVAYVFNEVKNTMKWNDVDRWYTTDGTVKAWENKTGNSAEINIILYHLLKQSGVKVYPMVVSTREHGKVQPYLTSLTQFNRTVVFAPIDSARTYVLDATSKYNTYFDIPSELLNSSGLYVDKAANVYDIIYLHKEAPVRNLILINADIQPGGKISGTAEINSFSYNRANALSKYKTDGEKKYIDYLKDDDNNLTVSSLKFDNMEVDSLPLVQKINFKLEAAGSDDNYIYLNPNLFTAFKKNVFLSENRYTNIEFGYARNYTINSVYKLPAGYKADALPKNISMIMPDKSIVFRRIVAEQDGSLYLRYFIDYKKPIYEKEQYPEFHEFYKKLHELMNEQVILKKS